MPTESRTRVAQALHLVFGQGSRIPDHWDSDLNSEDAAFAQALLGLCLRRWGRLQAYILTKLSDPDRGIPLGTQISLAIGFAQLAWLPGISDHAAVNEAVELTGDRVLGFPPHKGLVNALLRAGVKNREALCTELNRMPAHLDRTPFADRVMKAALAPRHQEHLMEELWLKQQEPPPTFFKAVKDGPIPEGLMPDPRVAGALSMAPGTRFPREWLQDGTGMVQDCSSQALMNFSLNNPPLRIADLCAAPGGKTTSLFLRWPAAEIYSVEQNPRRARRLEENLRARGVKAQIIIEEASKWLDQTQLSFDLILLDAPCSGSGTLRKHPELVWLGDRLDEQSLSRTQQTILTAALPRMNKGGILIYSVCSWLPEEGLKWRDRLLTDFTDLEPAPIWPENSVQSNNGNEFLPDPLNWEGEGFQAFAVKRK
jgi:16S rRNA (cytosine967-C5)-methyltransferase